MTSVTNGVSLFDMIQQQSFVVNHNDMINYVKSKTLKAERYTIPTTKKEINNEIPKNIYLAWHSKTIPPIMKAYIDKEINDNPEFNFFIYDLEMCRTFIKDNFNPNVLNAFDTLKPIAYKIDLWRYCILYLKGGIYLDIKFFPMDGFKFIDILDKERFMCERYFENCWKNNCYGVSNAFIIVKPHNIILLDCIRGVVMNTQNKFYGYNSLYPTGPGLCGLIYFNHTQKWDDMDLFFVGFMDERYTIQLNKHVILQSYPEYKNEREIHGTPLYDKMYFNKDIYN